MLVVLMVVVVPTLQFHRIPGLQRPIQLVAGAFEVMFNGALEDAWSLLGAVSGVPA